MIIRLKKDITVDNVKIHKNSMGTAVAIKWTDSHQDQYLVKFNEGAYLVDKSNIEFDKKAA
jgi:hypothetical protein